MLRRRPAKPQLANRCSPSRHALQGSLAEGFFAAYVPSEHEVEMSEIARAGGRAGHDSSDDYADIIAGGGAGNAAGGAGGSQEDVVIVDA